MRRCLVKCFLQHPIALTALLDNNNLCAEKPIEQQVCARTLRLLTGQHQNAVQTEAGCCRCRLAAVIRLNRTTRDQGGCTLPARLGDEELEFARLVATKGKTGLIVTLDQNPRSTEGSAQAR